MTAILGKGGVDPSSVGCFQAKMREELMKKFAEDDRLEQVSEHKRRMKVTAVKTVGVMRGTRMTKGFEMAFFLWREK